MRYLGLSAWLLWLLMTSGCHTASSTSDARPGATTRSSASPAGSAERDRARVAALLRQGVEAYRKAGRPLPDLQIDPDDPHVDVRVVLPEVACSLLNRDMYFLELRAVARNERPGATPDERHLADVLARMLRSHGRPFSEATRKTDSATGILFITYWVMRDVMVRPSSDPDVRGWRP